MEETVKLWRRVFYKKRTAGMGASLVGMFKESKEAKVSETE